MNRACHVYAIVRRMATLPPDLTGLNGEPLSIVPWQALAAVVAVSADARIQPTAEALLQHEMVVETLCKAMPALPVRFGTVLPDTGAVARALAERHDTLLADLARVGDKVELGLTVLWGSDAMPDELDGEAPTARDLEHGESQGRGRRYMLERRATYRRERSMQAMAQAVASDLAHHLQPDVCESQYHVDTAPGLAIRAAFLVNRSALEEALATLTACRSLYPALRFLITGPWPPYSFVGSRPRPAQEDVSGFCKQTVSIANQDTGDKG